MTLKPETAAKIDAAIAAGNVEEIPSRSYTVKSGANTYDVTLHPDRHRCTCEAGRNDRLCWHVRAALKAATGRTVA